MTPSTLNVQSVPPDGQAVHSPTCMLRYSGGIGGCAGGVGGGGVGGGGGGEEGAAGGAGGEDGTVGADGGPGMMQPTSDVDAQ